MTREKPDRSYSVAQLARLAGVSVRALHHYDEIGLLRPAHVGANGYRYYERPQLLRLQQILLHRRIGLSLADIASVLDAPDFDQEATLRRRRTELCDERVRLDAMITAIDRTLASLKGDETMTDAELYSGFTPPKKQAEYEAWLIERYGDEARGWISEARKRPGVSAEDTLRSMAELKACETALADAMRAGIEAESPDMDRAVARHRDWIAASWGRPCPPAAYANLADIYAHPDFQKRYESIAPGFADFLPRAMRAWAARQS